MVSGAVSGQNTLRDIAIATGLVRKPIWSISAVESRTFIYNRICAQIIKKNFADAKHDNLQVRDQTNGNNVIRTFIINKKIFLFVAITLDLSKKMNKFSH